jgi:hypothetical protein
MTCCLLDILDEKQLGSSIFLLDVRRESSSFFKFEETSLLEDIQIYFKMSQTTL